MAFACVMLMAANGAYGQSEHVPPDPPQTHVHDMTYAEMVDMMGMDDRALFGKVMLDRLEWRDAGESTYEWEAAAWYGGDYNKVWLATEGEHVGGSVADARVELLWDRILTAWWNTRLGLREDFGDGPSGTWLAFGVAGLAPGHIELEAMAYLGDGGRTALRLSAEYDLLITQRLMLQPEAEFNLEDGDDDFELGLRLRYEIRREIAPYLGVSWSTGEDTDGLTLVAGIRLWF